MSDPATLAAAWLDDADTEAPVNAVAAKIANMPAHRPREGAQICAPGNGQAFVSQTEAGQIRPTADIIEFRQRQRN